MSLSPFPSPWDAYSYTGSIPTSVNNVGLSYPKISHIVKDKAILKLL